jgi:hypothetical protein
MVKGFKQQISTKEIQKSLKEWGLDILTNELKQT